jgi:PAS domain S-box-containing protein
MTRDDQRRPAAVDSPPANVAPAGAAERSVESLPHERQSDPVELERQNEALRQAKNALEQSRDRYVELYEHAPVGLLTLSADGMIARINVCAAALLGVERGALRCAGFGAYVTAQDRDRWSRFFLRLGKARGQGEIELAVKHADGTVRRMQLNCTCPTRQDAPGADSAALDISLIDVTGRWLADDRLARHRAIFRVILDGAPDALFIMDRQGNCRFANRPASLLLGYAHEDLLTMSFFDCAPDEDRPQIERLLEQVLSGAEAHGELRLKRLDDGMLPVDFNATLLPDGTVFAACRDTGESRSARAALKRSEEFKEAILDSVFSQIAVLDHRGDIVEVNESWRRFALENGVRGSQVGINYLRVCRACVGNEQGLAQQSYDGILAVLEGRSPRFSLEYPCHSPERQRWFSMSVTPLQKPGHGVVVTHTDVSAAKLAEHERARQRDALVREVHHRIKNNLQGVAGLLHRELGKFLERDPRLRAAISQVNAIAIVHGLQSSNSGEAISLCESVRNICKTVSKLSHRSVSFRRYDEQGVSRTVWIDSEEAVPVALILNELILNAVKHSPESAACPTVVLRVSAVRAQVLILNEWKGTPAFDSQTGRGLGTGLRLVQSLLPKQGACLSHEFPTPGAVLTRLTFTPPLLVISSAKVHCPS